MHPVVARSGPKAAISTSADGKVVKQVNTGGAACRNLFEQQKGAADAWRNGTDVRRTSKITRSLSSVPERSCGVFVIMCRAQLASGMPGLDSLNQIAGLS